MTISLITVTYNSGNTLFSTLQSVFSQTHLDIEYIIVDGVSKDHTIDVLKEYEPKFNGRLRWISEPDKGLYDAMNKGIRMATGDVVGILNSDDFFTGKDVLAQVDGLLKRMTAWQLFMVMFILYIRISWINASAIILRRCLKGN